MQARTIHVYVGRDVREWLEDEAREQDRPMSRIIQAALRHYRDLCRIARSDAACEEEVKAVEGRDG